MQQFLFPVHQNRPLEGSYLSTVYPKAPRLHTIFSNMQNIIDLYPHCTHSNAKWFP